MLLTTNFSLDEFESKDGSPMPYAVFQNVKELAKALQVIRDHFGAPITVTSGYRSPAHNDTIEGAVKASQHTLGKAADLKVQGKTAREMYDGIEMLIDKGLIPQGGLGLYSNRVHYDIRGTKARWGVSADNVKKGFLGVLGGLVLTWFVGKQMGL